MERQDAGDRYLGAPGPVDMDARENSVETRISSRKHQGDQKLSEAVDHKDIKKSVVDIRMRSQLQSAALAVAVHAGYEIGLRISFRLSVAQSYGGGTCLHKTNCFSAMPT